jgi:hypothetical protein
MLEVPEIPKQQYFRIFGNQKFHIARKGGIYYYCLCGIYYPGDAPATPISEYVGDECRNCRYATSKKIRRQRRWMLEVKIRRAT